MTRHVWPIYEGIVNLAAVALFIACAIARLSIVESTKYMASYLVILFIGLLVITYIPWFSHGSFSGKGAGQGENGDPDGNLTPSKYGCMV